MDANGAVENCLGGAGFHRNRKTLHHLSCVRPDHVQAHHPVRGVIDQQLHQRTFGVAAERVPQWLEVRAVNGDLAKDLASLFFGVAHGTNVRVGEHCRGNEFITHAARFFSSGSAKQVVHHHHGLAQCDRGQLQACGHIAQRVHRWQRALVVTIDLNRAFVVEFHPSCFQTQAIGVGHAACGVQHGIDRHRRSNTFECDLQACSGFCDGLDFRAKAKTDTGFFHLGSDEAAYIVVEASQ